MKLLDDMDMSSDDDEDNETIQKKLIGNNYLKSWISLLNWYSFFFRNRKEFSIKTFLQPIKIEKHAK